MSTIHDETRKRIREGNQKVIAKNLSGNKVMKTMRERFARKFGFDPTDEKKFPLMSEGFSFQRCKEMIESNPKFREADTSGAFVQLLRAGIQLAVNSAYELASYATTWEDWTMVVNSKKREEPYAPMVGLTFPSEIAEGGKYPETGAFALDLKLRNRKFGSMYSVTWDLEEDDQTGQVMKNAKSLGEYMRLAVEVVVYGKLAALSGGCTYSNLKVRAPEMVPSYETGSGYPFCASGALYGGGTNRPASYGLLTLDTLRIARQTLAQQKNQLGLKMEMMPDTVLCGPHYELDSSVLAHSVYYPVTPASSAGAVGGIHSNNPLVGKFDTIVSKYHFKQTGVVDDGTGTMWYHLDKKRTGAGGFIVQMRTAAEVINEAANSGESFERDLIRFKARSRFNADIVEPRFIFRGNDGSITS
jgi:hypothetical protein